MSPEPAHKVLAQTCVGILLQLGLHIGDITDIVAIAKCGAEKAPLCSV